MNDRCARITFGLALAPATTALWIVLAVTPWGSDFKLPSLIGTVGALLLGVVTWRRYVRWQVLRSLSTAGIAALIIGQVLLWQPLWQIKCYEHAICTAQSLASLGAAQMGLAFVWWAPLLSRTNSPQSPNSRRQSMTPHGVRLVIALALIPLLPGVFFVCFFCMRGIDDLLRLFISYELCTAIALVVWLLLWRRTVYWTLSRSLATALLAFLFLLSPLAVFGAPLATATVRGLTQVCLLSPLFAWAAWLAGTAWVWRSANLQYASSGGLPAAEAEPRCPACYYSLRGLTQARCPECGWQGTIDAVVAVCLSDLVAVP
jgi:hypothetical protein